MPNTEGDIFANSGVPLAQQISFGTWRGIEALKDLMVRAGWQLVESTKAAGFLYTIGWFNVYTPTFFNDEGAIYFTVNDQGVCIYNSCGCTAGSGGGTSFGLGDPSNDCRNGFHNLGKICLDCNPGDDGWDNVLICDENGAPLPGQEGAEPHGGWFTGTFESFAEALVGCSPNYFSQANGLSRDGVPISIEGNVYVEANSAGPRWNSPGFLTAVGVGLANGDPAPSIGGGGYRLRSASANGKTQYEVLITQYRSPYPSGLLPGDTSSGLEFRQISFRIKELLTGSEVEYLLSSGQRGTAGTYNVIVNPYSLMLDSVSDSVDKSNDNYAGGNSLFMTAPYSRNPYVDYGLIVIGPGTMKNNLVWGLNGGLVSLAINGAFETYGPSVSYPNPTGWPGIATRNFPYDEPLLTSQGLPMRSTAWVMAPKTRAHEAMFLGVLWDSFIASKVSPHGSVQNVNNFNYRQVSRQTTAPECSLWMSEGFL